MSMLSTLTKSWHKLNIHILDNEASSILKQGLLKHKIRYHLVPPHLHKINASERSIKTFKEYFITCLYKNDPNYPAEYWDCFLPQATLTLKLLWNCHFNKRFHRMQPPMEYLIITKHCFPLLETDY